MGIIIKDKEPLVSFILTEYGKKQMSVGKLSFDYYAFGDSDIDYRTSDINSLMLKPISGINDLKCPIYKKDQSIFYPITDEKLSTEEITKNNSYEFKLFNTENKITTLDKRFISSEGVVTGNENNYCIDVLFDNDVEKDNIIKFDFITLYLNDEFRIVEEFCSPIYQFQIDHVIIEGKTAKIYTKQPTNSNLSEYRFFITSSNHIFFDTQTWNQVFCGGDSLSNNEKRFDGIRSYFESTDGLLLYHNTPMGIEDFNENSNSDFKVSFPYVIWDKSPVAKMGVNLHTTSNKTSKLSGINKHFNITGFELMDDYNNVVGEYYPDYRMAFINDIELSSTISDKNNRNWTLPEISYEYISSNGNGIFNKNEDDLYVTYQLKGNQHNQSSYCRKLLYIPNKKGDFQINLDFSTFKLPIISNPIWKINEVTILFQYVPKGGTVNVNNWKEITMLKGDNMTIENIRGKYGLNIQHLNRGEDHTYESPKNLDEQLMMGNVQYSTTSKKYITTFNFQSDLNKTLYTSNPTYTNKKEIRVSEVAVYDKNYKVVAYAKLSHSIKWKSDIVFTIKTKMIF